MIQWKGKHSQVEEVLLTPHHHHICTASHCTREAGQIQPQTAFFLLYLHGGVELQGDQSVMMVWNVPFLSPKNRTFAHASLQHFCPQKKRKDDYFHCIWTSWIQVLYSTSVDQCSSHVSQVCQHILWMTVCWVWSYVLSSLWIWNDLELRVWMDRVACGLLGSGTCQGSLGSGHSSAYCMGWRCFLWNKYQLPCHAQLTFSLYSILLWTLLNLHWLSGVHAVPPLQYLQTGTWFQLLSPSDSLSVGKRWPWNLRPEPQTHIQSLVLKKCRHFVRHSYEKKLKERFTALSIVLFLFHFASDKSDETDPFLP